MLRIVRSARHRFMRGLAGGSAAGRGKLGSSVVFFLDDFIKHMAAY
jgi:hypothetical protein